MSTTARPAHRPSGAFYLSKEGYAYRVLRDAHPEIPEVAAGLSPEKAANQLLMSYLHEAVFAIPQKLHKLLSLLLDREELDRALTMLLGSDFLEYVRIGKTQALLWCSRT
ncbi:MAG: hypothetical protein ACHQ7M_10300 [Chloroflexota bacterium]